MKDRKPTADERIQAMAWASAKANEEVGEHYDSWKWQQCMERRTRSALMMCFNCGDPWIIHVKGKCLFQPTQFDF